MAAAGQEGRAEVPPVAGAVRPERRRPAAAAISAESAVELRRREVPPAPAARLSPAPLARQATVEAPGTAPPGMPAVAVAMVAAVPRAARPVRQARAGRRERQA